MGIPRKMCLATCLLEKKTCLESFTQLICASLSSLHPSSSCSRSICLLLWQLQAFSSPQMDRACIRRTRQCCKWMRRAIISSSTSRIKSLYASVHSHCFISAANNMIDRRVSILLPITASIATDRQQDSTLPGVAIVKTSSPNMRRQPKV